MAWAAYQNMAGKSTVVGAPMAMPAMMPTQAMPAMPMSYAAPRPQYAPTTTVAPASYAPQFMTSAAPKVEYVSTAPAMAPMPAVEYVSAAPAVAPMPAVEYISAAPAVSAMPTVEYVSAAPAVEYIQQQAPLVEYVQQQAPLVEYVQQAPQIVEYVQQAPQVEYITQQAQPVEYVTTAAPYAAPRMASVPYNSGLAPSSNSLLAMGVVTSERVIDKMELYAEGRFEEAPAEVAGGAYAVAAPSAALYYDSAPQVQYVDSEPVVYEMVGPNGEVYYETVAAAGGAAPQMVYETIAANPAYTYVQ